MRGEGEASSGEVEALLGLPGIGPVSARRLADADLHTPDDLLRLLPLRYEDRRATVPISQLRPGERASTEGVIVACRETGPKWKRTLEIVLKENDATLTCLWFTRHRPKAERLVIGARLVVCGVANQARGALSMAHPTVALEDSPELRARFGRIVPIYPRIEGVTQRTIEKAIAALLQSPGQHLVDPLPADLLEARGLMSLAEALGQAHAPPDDLAEEQLSLWRKGCSPALERLAYDALLGQQLACARLRRERQQRRASPVQGARDTLTALASAATLTPTAAQERVVDELAADLSGLSPMQRLVQGEVGSGKTLVAGAAMAAATRSGLMAVMMAPTTVLAEQHFRTLHRWLGPLEIEVRYLSSSLPAAQRAELETEIAQGRPLVLVGTHALAEDSVDLPNLGLVVIDEQQRFGVAVRRKLLGKAASTHPHLLVVTATPIPRSVALVLHGDLDLSHLDELPPGRSPVTTHLVPRANRASVVEDIRSALTNNERVFWVCPAIEDLGDSPSSVERVARQLSRDLGADRIAVVTGRQKPHEREAQLAAFEAGHKPVLVATTVIEVGVDVPTATVMVVDGAQCFGLSTLHQLRGRVGRGKARSRCYLLHDELSPASGQRLECLTQTSDGMEIAMADLEQRGPGEILGLRQSGAGAFPVSALFDARRLSAVREDAQRLLAQNHDERKGR